MACPRHTRSAKLIFVAALSHCLSLCLLMFGGSPASFAQASQSASSPQTDAREQAVRLYEAGDAAGAAKALQAFVKQQKTDIRAWHYLGLALARQGRTKDARKAFEKSARLADELVMNQMEGFTEAYDLAAGLAAYKSLLVEGADSADKYLELSVKLSTSKVAEWQDRAVFLRDFAQLRDETQVGTIYPPKEVTEKARILSKPSPHYSEEGRQYQVTGTVVLMMIFSADGKVRGLIPVHTLPHGLTAEAIKAARAIRFIPAMKDGKPVSQFVQVEYNFNIY
ncbi:MAG: energy transducer TonB [Acidobacteria bacterium]|nr:energy transducer TonB [Acidobacteriota bacterium]